MAQLAAAWTRGFQAPRPSLHNSSRTLLQGVLTLKHMAVNSLENTAPFNRHDFDANSTYGVTDFVLADYYFRPFKAAIRDAGARGIMCSCKLGRLAHTRAQTLAVQTILLRASS